MVQWLQEQLGVVRTVGTKETEPIELERVDHEGREQAEGDDQQVRRIEEGRSEHEPVQGILLEEGN